MLVPRRLGGRFLHDPGSVLGLIIVSIAFLSALLAPVLPLEDPTQLNLQHRLLSPSAQYPLGTDHHKLAQLMRLTRASMLEVMGQNPQGQRYPVTW